MNRNGLLLVALFASLAVNLFVAGAFVGARLNRPAPSFAQELRARNPVANAIAALPPERQAAWRAELPGFAQAYGPRVRDARLLMRRTMEGFGDEPFDADAALADLRRARAMEAEGRNEMDRRIVAFAAGLPQPERKRFGEALAHPMRARRGPGDPGAQER